MLRQIYQKEFLEVVSKHLRVLYPDANLDQLIKRLLLTTGRYGLHSQSSQKSGLEDTGIWSEKDVVLITYADSLLSEESSPIKQLRNFATQHLQEAISTVHLLPFFPYSSDDGFSVKDYRAVNPESGTWNDITLLGSNFKLMFDWVLNHVSAESQWFKYYTNSIAPYSHFFVEESKDTDLSMVTRPRTSPLLTKVETRNGTKYVWTTFSADQVDLNFANPDVFFEMLDILLFYISMGAQIIRLDAVAFLWKEIGTSCMHHENTHEFIKLIRCILNQVSPSSILLTETNVPHEENISYFGNGDEAHMVYQFSLPPLVLHGLLKEDASHLTKWASNLPELPENCTFFNFTSSHDGIGMRPLQGILSEDEIAFLVDKIKEKNGEVSYRSLPDGSKSPYELNTTYFSALADEDKPYSEISSQRFLASQIVALSIKGIPGIYIHSLLASMNDLEGVKNSGIPRRINRKKLTQKELDRFLSDTTSAQRNIFLDYLNILKKRRNCAAFDPEATQDIIDLSHKVFCVKRSLIKDEKNISVLCLHSFSGQVEGLKLHESLEEGTYLDLLSDGVFTVDKRSFQLQPFQCLWLMKNF